MTLALVYYSASYGKLKIINENSSFISKLNNRLKQQFYGYLIEFSHLPCRAVSTPLTDGETETLRVTGPRTLVGVQQNQGRPAVPDLGLCLDYMPALPLGLCGSGLLASYS